MHTLVPIFMLSWIINNAFADVDVYEWNSCWDLPLVDETLFCYGAVKWNISETVYKELVERDDLAKNDYKTLLAKWQENADESKDPTND